MIGFDRGCMEVDERAELNPDVFTRELFTSRPIRLASAHIVSPPHNCGYLADCRRGHDGTGGRGRHRPGRLARPDPFPPPPTPETCIHGNVALMTWNDGEHIATAAKCALSIPIEVVIDCPGCPTGCKKDTTLGHMSRVKGRDWISCHQVAIGMPSHGYEDTRLVA
jgi:hypothetical protein